MLKYHPLKVTEARTEGDDALYLSFAVPADLRDEYRFNPGQHVGLRAQVDGQELRRNYSIAGCGPQGELRIGVRVQPDGQLTRHLASHVRPGDNLDVLPPNGSFQWVADPGRRGTYVAFAAGSGIAGILAIVASVLAIEPRSRCVLFYGNRDTARIMFLEELQALKNRYPDRLSLNFIHSREPQEVEIFNGRIDAAKVTELARWLFVPRDVDAYFVCGPGDMIDQVSGALQSLGVAAGTIHAERYGVERTAPAPRPASKVAAAAGTAQVTVVMDGRRRSFTMPMAGESIVDAAARAGLDLPYACKGGVCSTCRTRVVRGTVEMDTNYALEPEELAAGYVLACQSHPTTAELELDYDDR